MRNGRLVSPVGEPPGNAAMKASAGADTVLIFAFHRTVDWWRHLGEHLGIGRSVVMTDIRGQGDISVVDDFYAELAALESGQPTSPPHLDAAEVDDVIARCRTLRWLPKKRARAMTLAMARVLDMVLEQTTPRLVLSFPIDRYVMDVLERLARARGIPHLELTASAVSGMAMLLRRGALVQVAADLPDDVVEAKTRELVDPGFVPVYVQERSRYTAVRFVRTLGYFRLRAVVLRIKSWLERDPLNAHYLDAQPFLGHKCRWRDIRMLALSTPHWQAKATAVPRERRVLFGLQLFPEASIDYWIENLQLIRHEDLVVEAARRFAGAGFMILVKDHPLQFGFRQTGLVDRLLSISGVVLVPYDVPGNELLDLAGVNFTCTGTLGLQAALRGIPSLVTASYYSNVDDFIVYGEWAELAEAVARAQNWKPNLPLAQRQRRIVRSILRGCFEGDFFTFKKFDPRSPALAATTLGRALGQHLRQLRQDGLIT